MSTIDLRQKNKAIAPSGTTRVISLFVWSSHRLFTLLLLFSFLMQPLSFVYADEVTITTEKETPEVQERAVDDTDESTVTSEEGVDENEEEEDITKKEEISSKYSESTHTPDQETVLVDESSTTTKKSQESSKKNKATSTDAVSGGSGSSQASSTASTTARATTSTSYDDTEMINATTTPETHGSSTDHTDGSVDISTTTKPSDGTLYDSDTDQEVATTTNKDINNEKPQEDGLRDDGEVEEYFNDNETMGPTTVPTTTATSTQPSAATSTVTYVNSSTTVRNAQNRHQFAENECVSAGDGSFYCSKSEPEQTDLEDGVFSAMDAEGDKEIYIKRAGETVQITDDKYENSAPHYDQVSRRIVWHSLRNDRYQVISYDLDSGDSQPLTDNSYNSMEPAAYDNATVWQAWIKDNWEIILYENGEKRRLTENEHHDVAPNIYQDHIVWRSQVNGAWYIRIYDRTNGVIETIEGDESLIENPRFVLVYDSVRENGDTQTLGYDLENKQVVPLSSKSRPVPDRLPEPDTTGEERALINNKTQTPKSSGEQEGEDDDEPLTSSDASSSATTTTQTASSTELVIPPIEHPTDEVVSTSTDNSHTPTDFIEEKTTSTPDEQKNERSSSTEQYEEMDTDPIQNNATNTEKIEDLVVPTYEKQSSKM